MDEGRIIFATFIDGGGSIIFVYVGRDFIDGIEENPGGGVYFVFGR